MEWQVITLIGALCAFSGIAGALVGYWLARRSWKSGVNQQKAGARWERRDDVMGTVGQAVSILAQWQQAKAAVDGDKALTTEQKATKLAELDKKRNDLLIGTALSSPALMGLVVDTAMDKVGIKL